MDLEIADEALRQIAHLPRRLQPRVSAVIERLRQWPAVSGVKWLTGDWKGYGRIRTGDDRVVSSLVSDGKINVFRVAHRREVYAE